MPPLYIKILSKMQRICNLIPHPPAWLKKVNKVRKPLQSPGGNNLRHPGVTTRDTRG